MTLADIYTTLRDNNMINVLEPVAQTPISRQKRRGRPPKNPRPVRAAEPQYEGKDNKVVVPKRYEIVPDHDEIESVLQKFESKSYLKLRPERLKYTPFLTTRDPALQRALPAMTTTGEDEDSDDDESATPSSNKEIISTPADPSDPEDTPDKIAAGEDKATLQLVAALASPVRSLRKRSIASNPSPEHPTKALRSSISASPANGRRRSGRGDMRGSQSPLKAGAVPPPPRRRIVVESDEEWGEDADGEEEVYGEVEFEEDRY